MPIASLAFPPIPRVTNFAACQAILIANPFVVQWAAFTGATNMDRISLSIRSADNDYNYFNTPSPNETTALPGSATSLSIPANRLPPGVDLSAELIFARGSAIGTASGISYFSGSGSTTTMTFHTAGSPDTTAPQVSSSSPQNNAIGVSRIAPLKITFNETMLTNNYNISYGGINIPTTVEWTSPAVIKISPPSQGWPANTKISVTLNAGAFNNGFTDLSGNPLATKTLTFTTRS
jgi:hypothetical protein